MTVVYDATKLGTLPRTAQLVPSGEVVKAPVDESKVITSPDFPVAELRRIVRTAACELGIVTEEIEMNSAEVSSSTKKRELARLVLNLEHASLISEACDI